jgi:hypothetical protein
MVAWLQLGQAAMQAIEIDYGESVRPDEFKVKLTFTVEF